MAVTARWEPAASHSSSRKEAPRCVQPWGLTMCPVWLQPRGAYKQMLTSKQANTELQLGLSDLRETQRVQT